MFTLVTGASGRLGLLITQKLLDLGHEVVGLSRRPPSLESPRFHHVAFDLSKIEALPEQVDLLKAKYPGIDSLVLNAALIEDDWKDGHLDQTSFLRQLNANGISPFLLHEQMIRAGFRLAQVGVVSSLSTHFDAYSTRMGYPASKILLSGLFQNLRRKSLGDQLIRVYELGRLGTGSSWNQVSYEKAASRVVDDLERQRPSCFRCTPRIIYLLSNMLSHLPLPIQRRLIFRHRS